MKKKRPEKMTVSSKVSAQIAKKKKKKTSFFSDVKVEAKKVTWTKKGELLKLTKVVLTAVFVFAAGIYFIDLIIKSILDLLRYLVRTFIG